MSAATADLAPALGPTFALSATHVWIILAAAVVTYVTRIGGNLLMSRFKTIPRRVDVALNAVPAAVITTLVAPSLVQYGTGEILTLAVATLIGLRLPMLGMFAIAWILLVALRNIGL
ncbi:AzlD family protein [Pseudohoeflea coraliihabitans]|uniref:AzlD domain-containing protein n=1 Tax=Pseudohoeflea coraliihabitans TaxID=2860393 RepID=A0ABS6WIZ5_9HYPH|nr:AzlD domain-containing protein [Pseudohoeflea sp. DP4N28-3]MBW3095906.1 AzlD domain-containing protein [Pseudohoeflea sp. DP4N28-3]